MSLIWSFNYIVYNKGCVRMKTCIHFINENTQVSTIIPYKGIIKYIQEWLNDFQCTLWNLPDDGQKRPEHPAEDKWMHSVLRVLFVLKISTNIDEKLIILTVSCQAMLKCYYSMFNPVSLSYTFRGWKRLYRT
jgi:hypothetical protein